MEEHQSGTVHVGRVEWNDDVKNLDAVRREVGMVFQHFNLFPHLTVLENRALPQMLARRTPRVNAEERVRHFFKRVRIPEQAAKFPG